MAFAVLILQFFIEVVVRRLDWYLTILEKEEGIELKQRMQCSHWLPMLESADAFRLSPFLRGAHAARLRLGGQAGVAQVLQAAGCGQSNARLGRSSQLWAAASSDRARRTGDRRRP